MPIDSYGAASSVGMFVYSRNHIYDPENALLLVALFTALFVSVLFSKAYRKGSGVRSAVSWWKIIAVHSTFVMTLVGFIWFASWLAQFLPDWMTETTRPMSKPDSVSDFLFSAGVLGLHGLERFWLYVQSWKLNRTALEAEPPLEERERRGSRR